MAQSIKEQIKDNIVSTIEGVTVSNSYNQTVIYVTTHERKIYENESYPCVLVRVESDAADDTVTAGYLHCHMSVEALAYTEDTNDPQQALSYLAGDIIKAMMVDNTRGSLAIDTLPEGIDYEYAEVGEKPTGVVTVSFDIHYRVLVTDPYSSS